MRDVDTGHDPVVVTNDRFAAALGGSPADRAELPDCVVVTDDEFGVCSVVFLVLWLLTDRAELENTCVLTEGRATGQDYVRPNLAPRADGYQWSNDAERTNFDVIRDSGSRVDQRLFVYTAQAIFPRR